MSDDGEGDESAVSDGESDPVGDLDDVESEEPPLHAVATRAIASAAPTRRMLLID
jgi:hypothetical protein